MANKEMMVTKVETLAEEKERLVKALKNNPKLKDKYFMILRIKQIELILG